MANVKITELPAVVTITPASDVIPLVSGGATKKATPTQMVNSVLNSTVNIGIGTASPVTSALLDVQSTTKGVRFPNMTTTQKTAIVTPAAGLVVFDTTLARLCLYTGVAWQTITSA